jgi:hypothetical protein
LSVHKVLDSFAGGFTWTSVGWGQKTVKVIAIVTHFSFYVPHKPKVALLPPDSFVVAQDIFLSIFMAWCTRCFTLSHIVESLRSVGVWTVPQRVGFSA